ncbi:histidine phosphatase family protein [Filobacillus milosensis]|uniref:Histidine phosphatase family protein n=1 Tax=Filobacillus milosensis TaxID=94137 RepID=A0A4Y8IEB1_9BACI|nr:histidine phosphatase family protein [Filobacillus milosensis]TFB14250.1 histidine phosphatase family protein [Filobacillus milosensis]
MQIIVIRHGQSEADITGVHEGRADFPLTSLGTEQARSMAHYLAEQLPPELILTSPLKRAKKTAEILQEQIGCELIEESDLMEWNNGVLAGISKGEAAVKYPLPEGGRPYHVPIEKGESELYLRFRAERVFHNIITNHKNLERVAVVSHGGLISNFIKAFIKQPNDDQTIFPTGDTGIHLLEANDESRIVRFLNNQRHLKNKHLQI